MALKALLCVESFDPAYGGPAYSVRRLGYALAQLGVTVGFWTFDNSHASDAAEIESHGCSLLRGHFKAAINNSGKPDIVHDNSIWRYPNHRIAMICHRLGIARVVSTRGMLEPWAMSHGLLKKKLAWFAYQRRDLNRSRLLHATAQSEANTITELGLTAPLVVIPNGIDLPEAIARAPREARTALFLSRIHPKKGIDLLVNAWAALRQGGWSLRIVGPGDPADIKVVTRQIAQAGLEKDVIIEGPLYGVKKAQAFKDADLFVLPSYSENFGIVVAEALAYGLPVITTTGTPWQDLETHRCGWWVSPTAEGINSALAEALKTPPKALLEMGARGRDMVATGFGWDTIARQTLYAYEAAIRG